MVHGPILPTVPLTVKVRRSGGFAGLRTSTSVEVAPGSPAHEAALALLASRPPAGRSHPDGLRHEVTIASPARTVMRRTFSEPLPEEVATLLALVVSSRSSPS
jgi:hypothetical protein